MFCYCFDNYYFAQPNFKIKLDLNDAFLFKIQILFGSVFLLGDEFSQPVEEKRRYRAFFFVWKKWGPSHPHYEGKKKSKVAIFREYVSTSHLIIGGIQNFSTCPSTH
jgi:hypothetical protein